VDYSRRIATGLAKLRAADEDPLEEEFPIRPSTLPLDDG